MSEHKYELPNPLTNIVTAILPSVTFFGIIILVSPGPTFRRSLPSDF